MIAEPHACKGLGYPPAARIRMLHAELIQRHCKNRLVGHIGRDSTVIEAPDKSPIMKKPAQERCRVGRPCKGQKPVPAEPWRLDLQPTRNLAENLADLVLNPVRTGVERGQARTRRQTKPGSGRVQGAPESHFGGKLG